MTVTGGRKVNKKGRSIGALKVTRRNKIAEQFSARTITMVESPAFRVLGLSGHRVLARLEIELAHHGGQDNGRLPVTYEDFRAYGIDRDAIAPALRECGALGFAEVTKRGRAGNAEFRTPSLYRLTYIYAAGRRRLTTGANWKPWKLPCRSLEQPATQGPLKGLKHRARKSMKQKSKSHSARSGKPRLQAHPGKPRSLSISLGNLDWQV
jgi:hypothetical protein